MPAKNVTIADVAKKAGVSTMTVSRAINNKGEITESTRRHVLQVAADLGYRPSRLARGLATKQTLQLGLVVPDISNPFFSQIALGAQIAAWDSGYNLLLLNTMEDVERENAILDLLEESLVDGIISCSSRLPNKQLEQKLVKQPATVLINRQIKNALAGIIYIDDEAGAVMAVNHLLAGGRKKIALLSGPPQSFSGLKRRQGYVKALQQTGWSVDNALQRACPPTPAGGLEAGKALLQQHPEIDALYCYNDLVAVGALQACAALGLSVPDDVAVIGVDDIPLAKLIHPALTTLKTSNHDIGAAAVKMLLNRLRGQCRQSPLLFNRELIARQSAP